jgi:hypothetical protein
LILRYDTGLFNLEFLGKEVEFEFSEARRFLPGLALLGRLGQPPELRMILLGGGAGPRPGIRLRAFFREPIFIA